MKPELEEKLYKEFPLLYDKGIDYRSSCMGFGFECLDGWFDILYKLSEDIMKAAQENKYTLGLDDENSGLYVVQVKEKYGTLRYYTSYSWPEISKLIDKAENESSKTCEKCGKPGRLICEQHWYMVRCLKCINEMRQTPQPN